MAKIVAAINMTLDGFCDHTAIIPDDSLHQHYNELLSNAGMILFGRITYKLMESSWPDVVKNPTGDKPVDDFAVIIQNIPKVVFSRTLTSITWENAKLAKGELSEEVLKLRNQTGKDILVGSPGLIAALTSLRLIDEYQLCVHPVIAGSGLQLFKDLKNSVNLRLLKINTLGSGAVILIYEPDLLQFTTDFTD